MVNQLFKYSDIAGDPLTFVVGDAHPTFVALFYKLFNVPREEFGEPQNLQAWNLKSKTRMPVANTTVRFSPHERAIVVVLYSTDILRFLPHSVELNTGGYNTMTTVRHMNGWLNYAGIPVKAAVRDGDLTVTSGGQRYTAVDDKLYLSYDGGLASLAGLTLTLEKTADWGAWLSPRGNMLMLKGEQHADRARSILQTKYNVEQTRDPVADLLARGWVRLRRLPTAHDAYVMEVNDTLDWRSPALEFVMSTKPETYLEVDSLQSGLLFRGRVVDFVKQGGLRGGLTRTADIANMFGSNVDEIVNNIVAAYPPFVPPAGYTAEDVEDVEDESDMRHPGDASQEDYPGHTPSEIEAQHAAKHRAYALWLSSMAYRIKRDDDLSAQLDKLVDNYAATHGWETLDNNYDMEYGSLRWAKGFKSGITTLALQWDMESVDVTTPEGQESLDVLHYGSDGDTISWTDVFSEEHIMEEMANNGSPTDDPMTYVSWLYNNDQESYSIQNMSETGVAAYSWVLNRMNALDETEAPPGAQPIGPQPNEGEEEPEPRPPPIDPQQLTFVDRMGTPLDESQTERQIGRASFKYSDVNADPDYEAASKFYEALDEVEQRVVFEALNYRKGQRQVWERIPRARLLKVWRDYAATGIVRDEKAIDEFMMRMVHNVAQLKTNTALMGHDVYDAIQEVSEKYELTSQQQAKLQRVFETTNFAEDDRGQWLLSDYGLPHLERLLGDLLASKTAEDKLVNIDKMLNVVHQRGDLSNMFVEGGQATLAELSGQGATGFQPSGQFKERTTWSTLRFADNTTTASFRYSDIASVRPPAEMPDEVSLDDPEATLVYFDGGDAGVGYVAASDMSDVMRVAVEQRQQVGYLKGSDPQYGRLVYVFFREQPDAVEIQRRRQNGLRGAKWYALPTQELSDPLSSLKFGDIVMPFKRLLPHTPVFFTVDVQRLKDFLDSHESELGDESTELAAYKISGQKAITSGLPVGLDSTYYMVHFKDTTLDNQYGTMLWHQSLFYNNLNAASNLKFGDIASAASLRLDASPRFWRGGPASSMPAGRTALDVLNYERQTLGNADVVTSLSDDELAAIPARELEWLTTSKDYAQEFGDVEHTDIPHGQYQIVARDPDAGVLVRVAADESLDRLTPVERMDLLGEGKPFVYESLTGKLSVSDAASHGDMQGYENYWDAPELYIAGRTSAQLLVFWQPQSVHDIRNSRAFIDCLQQLLAEGHTQPGTEVWFPHVRQSAGMVEDLLIQGLGTHREESCMKRMADWQAWLGTQQFDIPTFMLYARAGQIWSFRRPGEGQFAGQPVQRWVLIDVIDYRGYVHGTYGYSIEQLVDGEQSTGKPSEDGWTDIQFHSQARTTNTTEVPSE